MIVKEIKDWTKGLVDSLEPTAIPVGSLSRQLNFLTLGDRMELRRGSRIIGTDQGVGTVNGLHVGVKLDSAGTQVPFRKRGRKLEYYDSTADDWVEIGSNVVPAAASAEDMAFDSYQSQAGSMIFGSSPSSSIYKILVANPGSVTDLLSTVYRGYLRIKQSRLFLWNRNGASGSGKRDEQNLYLSYVDARAYTTVTAEALTDVAMGTLAFKGGGSKRTCFGVVITHTASGETFTDNRDGTLSGSISGTGTINYTTGAFTTTASGAGTADYQWEDSTSTGLADFSFSGTRVAAQGNFFEQGDGGPMMGVETYGDVEYCAHAYKTYSLKNGRDDTTAENLLFRDREGIPNWRAIKGTSKGIFYVNAIDPGEPLIKLLTLQAGSTAVDGVVISRNIDLSGYRFDKCFVFEVDDYIIVGCRTADSTVNNRFIMYNKVWEAFDIVDFWGLCAAIYGGALWIGESVSQNVVECFTGVDDSGAVIDGFAELNEWDLEYPGDLKKVKELHVEGDIGPDQRFGVWASVDAGSFVKLGQISGAAGYVDKSQRVDVGSLTMGRGEVGGGSDGVEAYHYFAAFKVRVDRFERITIRFVREDDDTTQAEGIGYFSFSTVRFHDVRVKARKLPRKYRSA